MNEKDLSKVQPLSLTDLLKSAEEPIVEIYLKELNRKIIIKKLNNADLVELNKAQTDLERSYRLFYVILRKNDPSITFEQVMSLPADISAKLSNEIMKYSERFLSSLRRSKELSTAQKPKESSSSAENLDTNQVK